MASECRALGRRQHDEEEMNDEDLRRGREGYHGNDLLVVVAIVASGLAADGAFAATFAPGSSPVRDANILGLFISMDADQMPA